MRSDDPTQNIKPVRIKTDGYHSWSETEIAQFEARHQIGTQARLALSLLLYTGQRPSDVIGMGRQHLRDGYIHLHQKKTGTALSIAIHPILAEILGQTSSGHLTFLTTQHGAGFSSSGSFAQWFRKQCDRAALPHCSAHGLRKAAARRLAEAGCTEHEIAAITGHASLTEVQRYTKSVDQKRLAAAAIGKIKGERQSG